jgi:taurine dioxygenase
MASISVSDLDPALPFGARIGGVNWETLKDEVIRRQIRDIFWRRGMILFEGMEASNAMQVAVSEVFGPLQEHAIKGMKKTQDESVPGMVELGADAGKSTIYEQDGRPVAGLVDWHFDSCYTDKLNRGGVLRLTVITPEDGLTGFADGIQLWNDLSPEWRARAEGLEIVYHEALMQHDARFGEHIKLPMLQQQAEAVAMIAAAWPRQRAVHPAVWQRHSGEKVLHVCPWQAAGIEGQLNETGDALYAALWDEVLRVMKPYFHKWSSDQMIIWDNWRFIHSVRGHDPRYPRNARRTTIQGDYGLGRLEGEPRKAVAMA